MTLKLTQIGMILLFVIASCNKKDCFDAELYSQNKDNVCFYDCPGVIGCDGNKYCNECEANRKGIRVKNE